MLSQLRSLLGGLRVFVDERMEKTRANEDGQTAGQKGKDKRIYGQEEGKFRKQLSFAKAEIERLKENKKMTKKGRKNRSQLQEECKTISVAGLASYMEKKESEL